LRDLAKSQPAVRKAVEATVVEPLRSRSTSCGKSSTLSLSRPTPSQPISKRLGDAGRRARVQLLPNGDPDDTKVLRNFVSAVLAIEPASTGPRYCCLKREYGRAGVYRSGFFALAAIALLLWVTLAELPCIADTGAAPGGYCRDIGAFRRLDLPLNFANIIALPLLLGVGVAFKSITLWPGAAEKRRSCNRH